MDSSWLYDVMSRLGTTDLYEYITGREAPCSGADCAEMVAQAGGLTDWLQGTLATVFASIVNQLPEGGNFPAVFHESALYFGNSLQSVAFFLPLDALVYCLTLSLNVFFALWSFHVIRVVVNFVRGLSTERFSTTETYTESGGRSSFRISTSRHF